MPKITVYPRGEHRCPKCGSDRAARAYDPAFDVLVFDCLIGRDAFGRPLGCGHTYATECADRKVEPGAAPRSIELADDGDDGADEREAE